MNPVFLLPFVLGFWASYTSPERNKIIISNPCPMSQNGIYRGEKIIIDTPVIKSNPFA